MSNYISFSLYNDLPKYCEGAIRNARLAKRFYPGWVCIFWIDDTVPADVDRALRDLGAEIHSPEYGFSNRMFARFLINDLPNCDRYIIRDTDSRIGEREAAAVRAWVDSGKGFHSIRDHPAHAREINGGLFGATRGAIPSMKQLMDEFTPGESYGDDQTFLCRHVYPLVRHDWLQHDSVSRHLFPGSIPFPTKRNGSYRFVGEVFEIGPGGEDVPRAGDSRLLNPNSD